MAGLLSNDELSALVGPALPVIDDRSKIPFVSDIAEISGQEFVAYHGMDADTLSRVCRFGCIPMGYGIGQIEFLLIKSHNQRSVLQFGDLHIPSRLHRRARDLGIVVDHDFRRCLSTAVSFHPENERWLTEHLTTTLIELHQRSINGVSLHSVEIYSLTDGDLNDLIAGEIGYRCGGVYTSLTGFYLRSGAGTVQLVSLARLLERSGFLFWDLGMDVPYKRNLGARLFPRKQFLSLYFSACNTVRNVDLPGGVIFSCNDLIRGR